MPDPKVEAILKRIRRKRIILFIVSAVLLAVVYYFYYTIQHWNDPKPGSVEYNAYVNAEKFVKERLKYPSSVEFPAIGDIIVLRKNDTGITVMLDIEAQNDSGSVIRSHVNVQLNYHPETSQWDFAGMSVTRPEIFRE